MQSGTFHTTSDEWRRALKVAETVKQTATALKLEPQSEWLRQVLNEAGEQMRSAVIWAAAQSTATDSGHRGLRSLIVAADAARSDAALASYFLSFLAHEHLIADTTASSVSQQLGEVETGMDAVSRNLRGEAGVDPYLGS